MEITFYVYDIFPATCRLNEWGDIVDGPNMTDHWINSDRMLWLFDLIAKLKFFFAYHFFDVDPEDFMFTCRIARNDLQECRRRWPEKYQPKSLWKL